MGSSAGQVGEASAGKSAIAVLDRAVLAGPASPERDALDAALVESLSEYGLIHVIGHGIDPTEIDRFHEHFRAFAARPRVEKERLGGPEIWHQRGWTPPATERAVIAGGQPDFKECYFAAPLALDPVCEEEYPEIFAPNVWPEGDEAFRRTYLAAGQALHAVGVDLLRSAARGLGLPEDTFTPRTEGAAHVTRALLYLPLTAEQIAQGALWGEEHTDFNLLTLLPGGGRFYDPAGQPCAPPDPEAGLYLRSRPTAENPAGRRVRGAAPPGALIAQVGQQLEILTGGRLLATPHVITAPRQPGYSRSSMAHFIHVHPLQVLRPLDPFATREARAAYRPSVLAGTYALKTLVDIGLAPPEAVHQLGYRHYDRLAAQRQSERPPVRPS